MIQLSFLINEFYVELFILLLLIKFQFNICGYLFILLLMNFIFYVKFFICFHMCLRFSFYLILLSIWVYLSIYIDIVFVDLVFGLKFLLIIFFLLYMADKASLFFQKKWKLQLMSSSLGNDKFLFGMLYINLLNLVWF